MDRSEIYVITISKANSGAGGGGRASPIILKSLVFFCNHVEELQTVLFEVELIINNVRLTYIYRNTIETCLTITTSVMIFWIGGDMSLRETQQTSKLNIDSLKDNVKDIVLVFYEEVSKQFWRPATVTQVLLSRDSEVR